jgi:CheY-like chemotaxis protein
MSEILFLSSDPVLREKNLEIMQQSGLDAVGMSGCLDGLVHLDKNKDKVIIVDDELSDVSGYEACLKVRQQREVLIVLLGTLPESDAWARVEELGFDLYLRKPVSPRELLARIKAMLRRPESDKEQGKPVDRPAVQPQEQVAQVQPTVQPGPEPMIVSAPVEIVKPVEQEVNSQTPVTPVQQIYDQAPEVSVRPEGAHISVDTTQQVQSQPEVIIQKQEAVPTVVPPLERDLQDTLKMRVVPPPLQQQTAVPARIPSSPQEEDDGAAILSDRRVIKVVDALVSGKLSDITPVVDLKYKMGYAYPSVSGLIDTSEQDTINILEMLANGGILIKQSFEKFYVDPDGFFQLVPMARCPRCDSANLIKGQLMEHFSCDYVGLDRDFKQESRYVCPKCREDLHLIGTDYRNVGLHYKCQDCNEVFTTPVVKWRNMKTRKVWKAEELREVETFSYQFSPDKKGWLESQMKPKTQLVNFLKDQGYQVHELAQLTARSGAVHMVDVFAIRDDIITKVYLGIGILVAVSGEPEVGLESLFRFDTRAYDIGINYKVVIAIPKLGPEAVNFARRQMIRVYEAKSLAAVVADLTHPDRFRSGMQSGVEAVENQEGSASGIPRTTVVKFLRNRGYDVYERALILGKSGVEHVFDIIARKDDRIVVPTIAIRIASSLTGQPVGLDEISKFDAAAFDAGICNKVFLGLPQVSDQARQFATQQKIDVFEQQDLGKLI